MKKASKKQKSLKYAKGGRWLDKRRLIMGILFVGTASLIAAYSFAAQSGGISPAQKPPSQSGGSQPNGSGQQPAGSQAAQSQLSQTSQTSQTTTTTQASDCTKSPDQVGCCPNGGGSDIQHNCIIRDINTIINFLSAGVAIVIIGSIVVGGIQYMAAGDKAEDLAKAKHRIANALIALFVFLFTFAFLEWLVPGGLFK